MLIRLYKNKEGQYFPNNEDGKLRETNLVFDKETHIVYYKFKEKYLSTGNGTFANMEVGFMSPRLEENGEPCFYNEDTKTIDSFYGL